MEKNGELQARWVKLWKRVGAQGDGGEMYRRLFIRYTEAHRAYHTLAHIQHCLREFDAARSLSIDPDTLEMALWYHDAVYDPRAKDNEEASVRLFLQMADYARLSGDFRNTVSRLIMATAQHRSAERGRDVDLLLDIDLSILGQERKVFNEYERGIRKEYAFIPFAEFRAKRADILVGFLQNLPIYRTDFFQDRYDARAILNLQHSLGKLLSQPTQ